MINDVKIHRKFPEVFVFYIISKRLAACGGGREEILGTPRTPAEHGLCTLWVSNYSEVPITCL
jgi:hypothetical protein